MREREDFWCVSNWLFLRLKSCHNFIFIVKKWWDHEFSFLYVPIQIEIYSNICNSASNHKIIISVWNMNTCWILILLSSQLVYYLNRMISYVVFFICQWHRYNFLSLCKLLRTTSSFQWDWATGTLKTPSSLYYYDSPVVIFQFLLIPCRVSLKLALSVLSPKLWSLSCWVRLLENNNAKESKDYRRKLKRVHKIIRQVEWTDE